ncbi:hypothetical protein BDP27DRAFT_1417296 [Rhodocollybia butyracea]|uniref:Uncharacterized protein n=1 Tax=Rhodocollybia butyracea TaxID=206335 RepID=A0A9P5PVC6_9AGAR|nr:hypothetical protein BDP27DRAFT_1417296 [Rhodocollybia butyracea]
MLLLPHRWLGFALAVFISLVCAAPTSPSPSPSSSSSPSPPPTQINYVATLFLKNGIKATTVPNTDPSVWIRIYRLIGELGEDMGDRKGSDGKSLTWGSEIAVEHETVDKKSKSVMVYFELEGGQFCPRGRKCYGYIVTLDCIGKGKTKRPMQVGAIVTKNLDGSFTVVDYMRPV